MKVFFQFDNLYFTAIFTEDYQLGYAEGISCPFELISELMEAGVSLDLYKKYDQDARILVNSINCVYLDNSTKEYTSIYKALVAAWDKTPKFKVGKMYRFIYNGGTRSGIKRAVKVKTVSPTLINAEDLDTGDIKNYSFTKMESIEEIK